MWREVGLAASCYRIPEWAVQSWHVLQQYCQRCCICPHHIAVALIKPITSRLSEGGDRHSISGLEVIFKTGYWSTERKKNETVS